MGLYTTIPVDEGLDAVREALDERQGGKVSTEFLVRQLEIVLKNNICEFNKELFIQLIGTAMGRKWEENVPPTTVTFSWLER